MLDRHMEDIEEMNAMEDSLETVQNKMQVRRAQHIGSFLSLGAVNKNNILA